MFAIAPEVEARPKKPIITSVELDLDAGKMIVTGRYFGTSERRIRVRLHLAEAGPVTLQVDSLTKLQLTEEVPTLLDQLIVSGLPLNIDEFAGMHRLEVRKKKFIGTTTVTIGAEGPAGADGAYGPAGPQGAQGIAGPAGVDGTDGVDGSDGTSVVLLGSVADFASLPGGATQGDLWVTLDTGAGWVSDGAADWTNVGQIRGPEGPKGEQGVAGPAGPTGADGLKGDIGPKGDQGDQGVVGPTGPKGDTGSQGSQGPQGLKGDKGDKGEQGLQGSKGYQVPQGLAVPAGADGIGISDTSIDADGNLIVTLTDGSVINTGSVRFMAFDFYAIKIDGGNALYRFNSADIGNLETIGAIPYQGILSELIITTNSTIYTFDRTANALLTLNTADASVLNNVGLDVDVVAGPRGYDLSSTGILYGIFGGGSTGIQLRTINPQTGTTALVCEVSGARQIEAISFADDGKLYAIGSPTSINPSHHLYTLPYEGAVMGQLALISELDFTPLSAQGKDIDTLTIGPDGYLYAADSLAGTNAELYRINPVNADVVNLGATGVLELNGLAAVLTPSQGGHDGKSMLSGTGSPSDGLGTGGDTYLDRASGDLYFKISGT